ncbi:hypothetical protein BDZ45DRAFT_108519 [Acephala macrosclerotiorum]|nr:hypothetical protein BDZ45DRAFT_108519 [Acephala macrosclerotiorum]
MARGEVERVTAKIEKFIARIEKYKNIRNRYSILPKDEDDHDFDDIQKLSNRDYQKTLLDRQDALLDRQKALQTLSNRQQVQAPMQVQVLAQDRQYQEHLLPHLRQSVPAHLNYSKW